jgi:Putative  PD-(D/E)XK family member, (DUF4420)
MARLLEVYRSIGNARNKDEFAIKQLHVGSSVWVGRDSLGKPVVLIESRADGGKAYCVVLQHLSFEPWVTCNISLPSAEKREITAAMIRCTGADKGLQEHFLRALSPACEEFGVRPYISDVATVFQTLVDLFQALTQPCVKSVQGLWAELVLISRAEDLPLAIMCWQRRERSLIDFEHAQAEVEVKSCLSTVRRHHFKLAQLQRISSVPRYIASLILLATEDGASINDLWDRIEKRIRGGTELKSRLAERIARLLGSDWQRADLQKYDELAALASLKIFSADEVPKVGDDGDPAITEIEFSVDLSAVDVVSHCLFERGGPLLRSLFPKQPTSLGGAI